MLIIIAWEYMVVYPRPGSDEWQGEPFPEKK